MAPKCRQQARQTCRPLSNSSKLQHHAKNSSHQPLAHRQKSQCSPPLVVSKAAASEAAVANVCGLRVRASLNQHCACT